MHFPWETIIRTFVQYVVLQESADFSTQLDVTTCVTSFNSLKTISMDYAGHSFFKHLKYYWIP